MAALDLTIQIASAQVLPAGRSTTWNPGLNGVGGIPARDVVCSSVAPSGSSPEDVRRIQSAIDGCPVGQIVQLSEGTFLIDDGAYILVSKGITVRGAGPERTILSKTDGAKPFRAAVGNKPSPLIVVGPARWSTTGHASDIVASTSLSKNAEKGAFEVLVDDPRGFAPGQMVLLDEVSGASWQPDPLGRGKIWAAADWRVVWQKHDPPAPELDHFSAGAFPTTPDTAGAWFARADRPTAEIKQVASVRGSKICFTTPIHISYRKKNAAELSRYSRPHTSFAGIESMRLIGADQGALRFQWASHSWARNIEVTQWHGEGVAISSSFRVELRDFYIHDAAWAQVGGGGYALSLSHGSSEALIENGIVVRANKLMVARSAGAGSVVGYNYMDMSYINSNARWIETGLNASHMVGPHHVLFEGNWGHNAESDKTHGNSTLITFFRNHLRCVRAPFENQAGGRIDDLLQDNGPKRCVGLQAYSYDMSFIGNVLGAPDVVKGWAYETTFISGNPGIWMLGWDDIAQYPIDPNVAKSTLRHGNFDYASEKLHWDARIAARKLLPSLYVKRRPPFFDVGRGYVWPWVDSAGKAKLHVLPAKARYDAGTPFVQP